MQRLVRGMWSDLLGDGDTPPSEFRIFKAGANPSTKGTKYFTAASAARVLSEYKAQGVDQIIDLEHNSLDPEVEKYRNDAKDARGWYSLEIRNGELWAVGVRWAADGVRRLTEKTQRYISPAFLYDPKTGEIAELLNCALVSMPATHQAAPLVAASRVTLARAIDPARVATLARDPRFVALARRLVHTPR